MEKKVSRVTRVCSLAYLRQYLEEIKRGEEFFRKKGGEIFGKNKGAKTFFD